tara:strand:+ start:363 stop:680 length:318 start_codon:yes stop_codon:yes gene_type:complete
MTTLTQNEITVMKMCINYTESRETQRDDNHSDATPADIGIALGWNKQQVGGVLASLILKGMVFVDDRSTEGDPHVRNNPDFHVVYLTDQLGVDTIFDIIDQEAAA